MGDTTITVIAIFLAAILMFIFPLMAMSDRADDIAQVSVQTTTTEFVDNIRLTGKLTLNNYDSFVKTLSSTGNAYDVEMEIQVLDENPGKKTTVANYTKIGENVYYSKYTTQIFDELNRNNGIMTLKEGDRVYVNVKNVSTTISQQMKNFLYKVTGSDTYQISASSSGIISVTGI